MRVPLPAVALAALVLLSASHGLSAPPGPPTTRELTWEVTYVACGVGDGHCLAYDGQIPGPTLDVNLGDTVVLHLVNRVAETLPPNAPAHLASAPVSFHVHGTSIAASMDGVLAHPGTQLVESAAYPSETFTYTFRAAFAGVWHYHDHVLGADGEEGTKRGLFGALVVRNGAQPRPDVVVDLHAHDNGVNAGFGVRGDIQPGDDVEVVVVGLGNRIWSVEVGGQRITTAPGLSDAIRLRDVQGPVAWRAQWGPDVHQGVIAP